MRIAMISYHTCPLAILGGKDTGGMNVYVRELTRFLGQLGVHVDVFTRSQDEHVPHVLHDLGYGNRVVHIPAGPEVPLPKSELAGHISEFAANILNFAQSKGIQYDLIHSHYWMSGVAAIELKKAWNVPIVQMFHTLGHMKNQIARSVHQLEGNYRLDGEQLVLDNVDQIIAATPAEVNQLTTLYRVDPLKISVLPPGVDCSHFYPIPSDEAKQAVDLPPDSKIILFVGRIEPLKGIDTLLKAIAQMNDDCHPTICSFTVVIIGGDPNAENSTDESEMTRLIALRHQLGLDEMVVFLGKRDQTTLPYYYSAAEILVMPSFYESFGMVALESMACGTPVVASHTGGLAYLIQNGLNGFTVTGGDVRGLAKKLNQLLFNSDLRLQMGKDAAAYAKSYAWENIAASMNSIYESILTKY